MTVPDFFWSRLHYWGPQIQEMSCSAENQCMHTVFEPVKRYTNRTLPVEQWPESVMVLSYLAAQTQPRTIKDVAHSVGAPEITTRGRLARLESQGAVRATKAVAVLSATKQVVCTHYEVTPYGRECAANRGSQRSGGAVNYCINSVFSLGWAMKVSR